MVWIRNGRCVAHTHIFNDAERMISGVRYMAFTLAVCDCDKINAIMYTRSREHVYLLMLDNQPENPIMKNGCECRRTTINGSGSGGGEDVDTQSRTVFLPPSK